MGHTELGSLSVSGEGKLGLKTIPLPNLTHPTRGR
jgi:hypothetical protein